MRRQQTEELNNLFIFAFLQEMVKIAAIFNSLFFFIASQVGLSPLYSGIFWPIVPASDDS
jgi:hypothetical protein